MFKNYIKIAWRNLKKNRVYSFINIFGLTIGMTAAFLIFIWVKNEFSYDRYHQDAELIYRLTSYDEVNKVKSDRTPYLLGEDLGKQLPEIQSYTRIRPITGKVPTVHLDQQLFKEKSAAYVDENWFAMFHFDFIQGSAENFNSQLYSVIISESKARKYFGKIDVVGETLGVDGVDYSVQGVIKNTPPNSSFHYDFYMTVAARHADVFWKKWDNEGFRNAYRTYVKLSPQVSPLKVIEQANLIFDKSNRKNTTVSLLELKDTHFESEIGLSDLKHGDSKMSYILLLIGILLLFIACINYVNLTTARASSRIKEVGIQKVVGAERSQLFFQFIIESGLLTLTSLASTLILVYFCLPFFNSFVNNQFTFTLFDSSLWQVMGLTLFCTLLLTSIYPAILLSSFKPLSVLGGKTLKGGNNGTLRRSLVVAQFVISIVLIIGTLVIYGQMEFVNKQYGNYQKDQVFSFLVPFNERGEAREERMRIMKQELMAHSCVQEIAEGSSLINIYNPEGPFDWDGYNSEIQYTINLLGAGPNFDKVLNLTIKEGRWFMPNSTNDENNFILNETAIGELGIRQPAIGQRFVHGEDVGVIVGVVQDFHFLGVREKIAPIVFTNNSFYLNSFILKSAKGRQIEARAATEEVFKKFFPDQPFDYQFVSDEIDQLYHTDYKVASMITIFSLLAIFLSCMGLFGLAAFIAESRNKEIGIRKVLGASVVGIVKLLSSDFVKLVFIAIFIATPIAWWMMNKWLQDFAYRIDIEWWVFAFAGMMAIIVAIFTVATQAVKAAVANPVGSLRDE
jgi:ABC-type antimicrobial peptide transport system permease subunit